MSEFIVGVVIDYDYILITSVFISNAKESFPTTATKQSTPRDH